MSSYVPQKHRLKKKNEKASVSFVQRLKFLLGSSLGDKFRNEMCQLLINDVLEISDSNLPTEMMHKDMHMCRFIFVPFYSFEQIQRQTAPREEEEVEQEDEE